MTEQRRRQLLRLGLMIGYYRKLKGLTQEQLAKATGLSRTHISNVEAPGLPVSLSVDKLFDIAQALDVPVAKLFDFKD